MEDDKKIITEALTHAVGEPVKIEWVVLDTVPSEPAKSENTPEETNQKTPLMRRVEAEDDPQLKTALTLFEATVLETQ
ncbi:hypothetical protein F4Y59_05335 [Candidatus Poribacteria bacterium]|nr:hypothetical protein [Candidatus Poribacteria bacterium]